MTARRYGALLLGTVDQGSDLRVDVEFWPDENQDHIMPSQLEGSWVISLSRWGEGDQILISMDTARRLQQELTEILASNPRSGRE